MTEEIASQPPRNHPTRHFTKLDAKRVCATSGWNYLARLSKRFNIPQSTSATWVRTNKIHHLNEDGLTIVPEDAFMELVKNRQPHPQRAKPKKRRTKQPTRTRKSTSDYTCGTPGWDFMAKLVAETGVSDGNAYRWVKAKKLPSSRSPEGFMIAPADRFRELAKTVGLDGRGKRAKDKPRIAVSPLAQEPIDRDKFNFTPPPAKLSPKQLEEAYVRLESGFIEQTNQRLLEISKAMDSLKFELAKDMAGLRGTIEMHNTSIRAHAGSIAGLRSDVEKVAGQKKGWFR